MINVLFAARTARWNRYETPLRAALAARGIAAHLACDIAPEEVDFIIYAPDSPLQDFTPYTRCLAVLNLWAGVERIVGNPTLTQPLCRMVEPGLVDGMREWVCGHVLRHHLGMDRHIHNPAHRWDPGAPPLARERRVAVMGLGELGSACAVALRDLGFQVSGWSRRAREIGGVACYHGDAGEREALSGANFVVLLLPLTTATADFLNARRLSWLAPGAFVLNPGRGGLIEDHALLSALDTGHLAHATLDAFRTEPLPAEHPFWAHPQVTVCPHIASETRPLSASEAIVSNIGRALSGEGLLHVVDRGAGY